MNFTTVTLSDWSELCFTTGKNEGTEIERKCDKTQLGFDKDRLCQTNLISFVEEIIAFLDKGNRSNLDLIYLEARKTFDA